MSNNTTTVKAPSFAARQWLRVNEHYLKHMHTDSPLRKAAAVEYRQKFNRDMEADLAKAWRQA